MKGQTGSELVKKFKTVIARMGAPMKIRTDNGPCYVSQEWRGLMSEYDISHSTSSPHHHEANGLAERSVETVKGLWRKESDKNKALLAYRTTALESGYRPDELLYGRRLRNELPALSDMGKDSHKFRQRDSELKSRQKRNFDHGRRARGVEELQEGQNVWIKISHEDKGKSGVIKYKAEEPDSYWVETDKRLVRRTRKHLRPLPPEPYREETVLDPQFENDVELRESNKGRDRRKQKYEMGSRPPSSRNARKLPDPDYEYY